LENFGGGDGICCFGLMMGWSERASALVFGRISLVDEVFGFGLGRFARFLCHLSMTRVLSRRRNDCLLNFLLKIPNFFFGFETVQFSHCIARAAFMFYQDWLDQQCRFFSSSPFRSGVHPADSNWYSESRSSAS
jgi:hypothetical protein